MKKIRVVITLIKEEEESVWIEEKQIFFKDYSYISIPNMIDEIKDAIVSFEE